MPEINKPADVNKIWSANGEIVVPADTKINSGWVEEIPPHEWENYIQNKQDLAIAHINQHGIAIWDSVTEYQANRSVVQTNDGRIWKAAKTNTNINPTTDTNQNWFNTAETGFVVISATGRTEWTVPAILKSGFKKAKITATGGGGSGGSGAVSGSIRGAGGGAGGTSISVIDLTGVSTVQVTVGSGGARRTTQNADGSSGTQTTFGTYLNANGGGGGGRYASNTTLNVSGGIGGSASGGQLNMKGGDGSDGPRIGTGADGGSGDGGASFWGGGIRGGTGSAGSTVNQCPGSGGGGGTAVSSPGANGVVVIEW